MIEEQPEYKIPKFLATKLDQKKYSRWLARKAASHARRDRKRSDFRHTVVSYKRAIHEAVLRSEGYDTYTGEQLAWSLVSTYNNEKSKLGRRAYKASFGLLPTVDHVGDGSGPADFRICSWRTNDAKHDLSHDDFIELCRKVIAHSERKI